MRSISASWRSTRPCAAEVIARALVDLAEDRAKASGLGALELETRIELIENHEAFQRLGFVRDVLRNA